MTGVASDGRSAALGFVTHDRRLDMKNLVEFSARSSLLASQKVGKLVKLGDLAKITMKSKRKSFENIFLILFS